MAKIKILPEELVNKIAAGEVVERPASVVKELLDNAYDAHASQINVEIEEGGIKKILVTDNGTGMSKEDAELAFKSHATSKISTEDDLFNIKDYGFRGEALSSIAAVSKITLKTREATNNLGIEIKIEGGQVISTGEAGSGIGTSVLVEDLFYNVPARKEFLKSAQSEYRAILDIVDSHAIANPDIGLNFVHNGKVIYSFPKNHQIEDRIREVFGNDRFEKLLPLFFEHPHIEIYGYVGKPEMANERQKNQYLFINKRAIRDKSIAFAIKDAYSSLIPKNTQPAYVVFVDVPGNIVDVNVHPRKEEVKFSNGQLIFESVKTAVKKALDRSNLTPGAQPGADPFGASDPFGKFPPANPFAPPQGARPSPFANRFSMPQSNPQQGGFGSKPFGARPFSDPFKPMPPQPGGMQPLKKPFSSPYADTFFDSDYGMGDDEDQSGLPQRASNLKILPIHNLYLVVESESGIFIFDQHAVHERIIYEKLINAHKENKDQMHTQELLAPVVVNLSAKEHDIISEFMPKLEEAGFVAEEFGPTSYKITQVPAIAAELDIKELIHEFIADLEDAENLSDVDRQTNKILTYLSCRMAYKAGDSIPLEEAAALIEKLETTDIKYTCPHGRPVKVEITLKELAKMFKRE